jgi:hypothetical protein
LDLWSAAAWLPHSKRAAAWLPQHGSMAAAFQKSGGMAAAFQKTGSTFLLATISRDSETGPLARY